jgi:hypothetical protein
MKKTLMCRAGFRVQREKFINTERVTAHQLALFLQIQALPGIFLRANGFVEKFTKK